MIHAADGLLTQLPGLLLGQLLGQFPVQQVVVEQLQPTGFHCPS